MKYAPLVLKHLRKNWIRTLSTVLAMAVCIFLICTLQTVVDAVNYGLHLGNASRLVTRHYVSLVFNLPNSYKAKIAAVPGVENTTIVNWFGGIYRGDMKYFFANFAVEPEPFLQIYPEIMLPEDQKQAWFHDGRGCIVGRKLAEKWGWKVGDTFQLESFIPPYRVGKPFDFVIDGIYDTDPVKYPGTDLNSMYFNYKYLYEATGQRAGVGTITVLIDDPKNAGRISKAIDAEFENSDTQTKTETEQAFRASFIAMAGNLALLLNGIGLGRCLHHSVGNCQHHEHRGAGAAAGDWRAQDAWLPQRPGDGADSGGSVAIGCYGRRCWPLLRRWHDPCPAQYSRRRRCGAHVPRLGIVSQDCVLWIRGCPAAGAAGGIHPGAAGVSRADN